MSFDMAEGARYQRIESQVTRDLRPARDSSLRGARRPAHRSASAAGSARRFLAVRGSLPRVVTFVLAPLAVLMMTPLIVLAGAVALLGLLAFATGAALRARRTHTAATLLVPVISLENSLAEARLSRAS